MFIIAELAWIADEEQSYRLFLPLQLFEHSFLD